MSRSSGSVVRTAFVTGCGVAAGVYVRRRQCIRPRAHQITYLNARQAMTVAAIANIVGLVAMATFLAYSVSVLWQL